MDIELVLTGMLPTLVPTHTVLDNMSEQPRYRALNDQIIDCRGDDITLDIKGDENLRLRLESVMGESANTSIQVHLQVTPASFANYWNASQAIAGVQVALGANSPFLFGHRLWDETRIPLFEQAVDERPAEQRNQGIRPRVWFGERWITSIFDLFEENVRYFGALLPACDDEDPETVVAEGGCPGCSSCGCTTGPSTAGTARSMTSATACRICGSRTGCCRPARPWWTCSPTRRSMPDSPAAWPRPTVQCGASSPSARPGTTSLLAARHGMKPHCSGHNRASRRRVNSFSGICCRPHTPDWTPSVSTRPPATACSA